METGGGVVFWGTAGRGWSSWFRIGRSMSGVEEQLLAVAEALGHGFEDADLLRDALTHRSFANERPKQAPRDNERLEYLGDSVIGLAASRLLYGRFPNATEGELTRRRADLVCEAALAEVAREIGVGDALRLGKGEARSGGREKPRLLASALEACVGAVCIDGGIGAAIACTERVLESRVSLASPGHSDFKSRIQELAQARQLGVPTYQLVDAVGPDHQRIFHVSVSVDGQVLGDGSGGSKLEAEQAAAREALPTLEADPDALGRPELPDP